MTTGQSAESAEATRAAQETGEATPLYCEQPVQPVRELAPGLARDRFDAIVEGDSKWVNETILHYYFFDRETDGEEVRFTDGTTQFISWVGDQVQQDAVRDAFKQWKGLPLGLEFREVTDRTEAEIRIGFMDHDGSWSYLGRGILEHAPNPNERTMNYGWDLTTPHGRTTALHEIGHTLGMPHEHQNPFAGIVWDEEKVYTTLGGPPNNWNRDKVFHNVLRKLSVNEVSGSSWDPDSVMEYKFGPGLIKEPEQYRNGVTPKGGLSDLDKEWARKWYPGADGAPPPQLTAFKSVPLMLGPAQQADFSIIPDATRSYDVGTFGNSDTVMVLFEEVDGELRFLAGDDDSGEERNAHVEAKLFKGKRYVVRIRLYWVGGSGETAVMYW